MNGWDHEVAAAVDVVILYTPAWLAVFTFTLALGAFSRFTISAFVR